MPTPNQIQVAKRSVAPEYLVARIDDPDRGLLVVLTQRFDGRPQLDPTATANAYPDIEVLYATTATTRAITDMRYWPGGFPFNGGIGVWPAPGMHNQEHYTWFEPDFHPHRAAGALERLIARAAVHPDTAFSTSTGGATLREVREAEVAELNHEVARLRKDLADARAQRSRPDTEPVPVIQPISWDAFLNPADAIQEAVRREWVDLVPASDKPTMPCAPLRLHPRAIEHLQAFTAPRQARTIRAITRIVTGYGVESVSARRATNASFGYRGEPIIRAADSAHAWRGVIERNVPSAARIAWWVREDGGIEISDIANHDDLRNPHTTDEVVP